MISNSSSIIIATRNSEACLSATLASLDRNWSDRIGEVLFIDGGSRDMTIQIIAQWHRPHRLYRQRGCGIYNALNEGVALARFPWVIFLHSDDIWLAGLTEASLGKAEVVWVGDISFFRRLGEFIYTRRLPFFPKRALRQFPFIFHPNAIYPRDLLCRYPFDEGSGNRRADMQQIAKFASQVRFRRHPTLHYGFRIHGNSTTAAGNAKEGESLAYWFWRVYVFLFYENKRFYRIGGRLLGKRPWKT